MRPDDANRIKHMIEAAEAAQSFIAGRDRKMLDTDTMLLFALIRAVEISGEAAARLSPQARAATPAIPWAAIIAMRNRLVHAYFDIDRDILWVSITEELPDLLAQLRAVA